MHPRLHIDVDTGPHLADRVGDTLDGAIVLTTQPDPHWHSIQLDQNMIYAFASRELVEEIGEEPDAQTLSRQTFLLHNTMSASLGAWSQAIGLDGFEPTAIDHFDSGQLMVEAAAQGLGIAIMHDDHYTRASDKRLARIYPREIASPNSYFFICQPRALEQKPLRLFHDWLVTAEL
jgi:LysR family glycine cleavage system transcriptional activator